MFFNKINLYAQKPNIIQTLFHRGFGATPQSIPFDINTYIVNIGIAPGKANCVITVTTGQLQHNGILIPKYLMPPSFGIRIKIQRILKRIKFCKLLQFSFAHWLQKKYRTPVFLRNLPHVFVAGDFIGRLYVGSIPHGTPG